MAAAEPAAALLELEAEEPDSGAGLDLAPLPEEPDAASQADKLGSAATDASDGEPAEPGLRLVGLGLPFERALLSVAASKSSG